MRPKLRRTIFQNSFSGGRRTRAAGPGTRPAAATGPGAATGPAGSRRAAATAAGRRSGPGGRSRRAGRAAATAAGRSGRRGGSRGRASRSAAASACVRSVSRDVAPGGTRTHNLRLRRATPCPLGHESYEYRHRTAPSRRRPPPVVVAVPRVVAPPRRRRAAAAPKVRVPARRVRVVAVAAGRAARAPALHEVEAHLVVEARPRRVIPVRGDAARDVLGAHLPALLVEDLDLRSMRGDVLVTMRGDGLVTTSGSRRDSNPQSSP